MFPKPARIVDEEHLKWVRSLDCAVCGRLAPSHPHHVKTRGSGGSDYYCIPLCGECHREAHMARSRDPYWVLLAKLLVKLLENRSVNE